MVTRAHDAEIDWLAQIWYEGRREAHEHLVPKGLLQHRMLDVSDAASKPLWTGPAWSVHLDPLPTSR
jgi:hypothetical protein